ncbi:MAG: 2-oxoacid:acceptor oxidoreductase family protein [Caldimicrobium thiodismutans]
MKLVILGKGGQGVLFFSKILAQMALNEGRSVKATEIKGMAKKGGVVEVQMKIDEGLSPLIKRGEADLVILLSPDLEEYGKTFGKKILKFSEEEIKKAFEQVPQRLVNTYLLGILLARHQIFNKNTALKVLDEENKKSFLRGYEDGEKNVQSQDGDLT